MKTIVLSHYTVRDIMPEPWKQTWDNLVDFAESFAPKLASMELKLQLRKVILDTVSQDNLMLGNMVTIKSDDLKFSETPIENLLMLELDFSECPSCVTPQGVGFACRTFKDFDGKLCQALPEEFFIEAVLRVAFKSTQHKPDSSCGCDCDHCASGCDEEGC